MKKVVLNLKSQGREPSSRPAHKPSTSFQSLPTKTSMKNDSQHSIPAPTQFVSWFIVLFVKHLIFTLYGTSGLDK